MPTYDIKPLFTPEIDQFLERLSDEAKNKLWKVVNALRLEFELSGSSKFKIPFDKLKRNNSSDEDAKASLINLHNNGILKVSSRLKVGYKPDRFSIKTINEESEIYSFPNTEIEISKDKFIYLEIKLRNFVHPKIATETLAKITKSFRSNDCLIKKRALELIAKKINSIESLKLNARMGEFLGECGVEEDFYRYIIGLNFLAESVKNPDLAYIPTSKYSLSVLGLVSSRGQLIFRILSYYSCFKEKFKGKQVLFAIIENSTDPLLFDANKIVAEKYSGGLNSILEFEGYHIEDRKIEKIETEKNQPLIATSEEKDKGFLKIDEQKIPIGIINSAKYQLLKSLCDPIGRAKSLDHLFEKIEIFTRKKNTDVFDAYLTKNYKKHKIEGIIKELQRKLAKYKISKKFKFTTDNSKAWLYYK